MQLKINSTFVNGHLSDEAAARYIGALTDNRLDDVPDAILSHVEECAACRDRILEVSLFIASVGAPETAAAEARAILTPAPPVQRAIRSYWTGAAGRAAAGFAAAAVLLGLWLLFFNQADPAREIVSPRDSSTAVLPARSAGPDPARSRRPAPQTTPVQRTEPRPAAASAPPSFRPNPALERMIGSTFRSAAIQDVTPPDNVELSGEILFQWKYAGAGPITLKVVDNRNAVRFSITTDKRSAGMSERLAPGVYYWKLENSSDLLYTGKFFIK